MGTKASPTGPGDACTLVISAGLQAPRPHSSPNPTLFFFFPPRVLNQANNEALHPNPHPLQAAAAAAVRCAGWHVACEEPWLAQVPPNHRTHNIPCPTTGHLEDIIGSARQKQGEREAGLYSQK